LKLALRLLAFALQTLRQIADSRKLFQNASAF